MSAGRRGLEPLRRETATDAQRECVAVLSDTFLGEHHVPKCYVWGKGILCACDRPLSTFDFDGLTRLVVSAHDRCVRVEIAPRGPQVIAICLHKRSGREGAVWDRHPTLERGEGS